MNQRRGHTRLRVRECGSPNSDDMTKSLVHSVFFVIRPNDSLSHCRPILRGNEPKRLTANEGLVRIQYKCQVPIYVFPDMKLRGLVISKAELQCSVSQFPHSAMSTGTCLTHWPEWHNSSFMYKLKRNWGECWWLLIFACFRHVIFGGQICRRQLPFSSSWLYKATLI